MDRGDKGSGASNSATEHAPGQMKDSGSAKDFAPGQTKEGTSAKDYAPGQQKEDSATRSDEKGGSTRKSEESEHSRDMKSREFDFLRRNTQIQPRRHLSNFEAVSA